MTKAILAIFGLIAVCLNPILSGIFIGVVLAKASDSRSPRPAARQKEPALSKKSNENKGFTTIKERQEENCRRFLKPGFQDDPAWQAKVKEIHKIMDENRRIEQAKRDAGDWN